MDKNSVLLITGGTGSFGNAVLKRFLDTDIGEIRDSVGMRRSKMICVSAMLTPQVEVLYWRCPRLSKHSECYSRCGLHFPCGCIETGSLL